MTTLSSTSPAQNPEHTDTPSFEALGLPAPVLRALVNAGYHTPTPIQAQAIPLALAGHDLLMSAQTGSGKTAAFVLPILAKLAERKPLADLTESAQANFSQKSFKKHQKPSPKALILTPTRELATQVHDSVRTYSNTLKGIFSIPLVGGSAYGGQIRALNKGVHVIIATPGRLIDHMDAGRVDLSELEVLVLDEADRMLDMGFSEAIERILADAPSKRQTLMSSATWDGPVGKIAKSHTQNPQEVSIAVETAHIDESVYYCDDFGHKNRLLDALITQKDVGQAVIFTATKMSSECLANDLVDKGHKARYLHGDLPQAKRNRIIQDVKSGKCQLLIATDVAARGIDIAGISHVINYDLPRQVEDYVHRIGRSGRAGRTGVAINLCSLDDKSKLDDIKRYLGRDIAQKSVEGLESQKAYLFDKPKARKRSDRSRSNDSFGVRRSGKAFSGDQGSKPSAERKFGKKSDKRFEQKPNRQAARRADQSVDRVAHRSIESAASKGGFDRNFDKGFDRSSKPAFARSSKPAQSGDGMSALRRPKSAARTGIAHAKVQAARPSKSAGAKTGGGNRHVKAYARTAAQPAGGSRFDRRDYYQSSKR